jgi:hypothetical protein
MLSTNDEERQMSSTLLLLLSAIMTRGFGPNVRIDHQNLPTHICHNCAIAVGPGAPSSPPLYVVFQDDSCTWGVRADIWFQKSTNGGRTWLPADVLIRRGNRYACYPDITTDSDGNVFIIYLEADTAGADRVFCVHSSDGGTTWSAPAKVDDSLDALIGRTTIAADSAGNLFCAWNGWRTGSSHIWSSVSTDQGATWRQNVQVDDDTTDYDCCHADVFVQPGTNQYLVTADIPRWFNDIPHIRYCAYLYRSTDCGQTFQPGVQLDTFDYVAGNSHVVADRDHIICDYFGHSGNDPDPLLVEARTFYTQPDTWGTPYPVTNLDSLHSLYYSGTLALSADGRVHTALMISNTGGEPYLTYYACSQDHGVSWSDLELVNEDTTARTWYPDIGADSDGHAYVVWEYFDGARGYIWFATNNPLAVAEQPPQQPFGVQQSATVVRNFMLLPEPTSLKPQAASSLLDIGGRQIMVLKPGANDVRALAPGVYFVGEGLGIRGQGPGRIRKVIVTR